MTMDIIDKRIYSCNEAICKNIESLQANERGLLSQNILSQLRNFLECVFLKIYVASGNSLIENEYQNIKNAIKFINTLQGKYHCCQIQFLHRNNLAMKYIVGGIMYRDKPLPNLQTIFSHLLLYSGTLFYFVYGIYQY